MWVESRWAPLLGVGEGGWGATQSLNISNNGAWEGRGEEISNMGAEVAYRDKAGRGLKSGGEGGKCRGGVR